MSADLGNTHALHSPEAGICEQGIEGGPRSYAGELARYINSPSTIRARVLDRFGHAPSIEDCRRLREARQADRADYRRHWDNLGHRALDQRDFQVKTFVQKSSLTPAQTRITSEVHEELPVSAPVKTPSPAILPTEIIAAIARDFDLIASDITGPSRKRYIVKARQTAAHVLRERGNSFPNIGTRLGGRDHTTILHACTIFRESATPAMRAIAERYIGRAA